jgi:MFS family permease
MNTEPFTLGTTLKHELCHLLLSRFIQTTRLPRWLDEGVCQWASGGLAELVTGSRKSVLAWAALSGSFIALNALSLNFPQDEQSLALAYEESRSVVEYIVSRFGKNGILNILDAMKNGQGVTDAVSMSLGMSIWELERQWQGSQRRWTAVIAALVANLYTILFVFGALLTMAVYIRLVIRKRRFKDEEEDDSSAPSDAGTGHIL